MGGCCGPTAPRNLYAFDFGCETWLFWDESVDDVDPQSTIFYEVRVNDVNDGGSIGMDRWTRQPDLLSGGA